MRTALEVSSSAKLRDFAKRGGGEFLKRVLMFSVSHALHEMRDGSASQALLDKRLSRHGHIDPVSNHSSKYAWKLPNQLSAKISIIQVLSIKRAAGTHAKDS